ncbi:hypothetical protein B0H14DRAFT_2742217 [Mycena olivaceomarginata]|nr:hypothetical protein B0H14DRAFT_2742217 [Mycena olivaceomarginata]
MKSIFRQLRSFQLGYTEERPYPWKWTTPIVLGAFLLISAFLTALNVPLSAYNIVQEFTYRPNDTLPAVALSSLVPSVFQQSANSFTPQLLTVGDVIRLNGSLFNYTILDAFNGLDEDEPVSSFLYSNNPFSEGCDVANITINFDLTRLGNVSLWDIHDEMLVVITCRVPTLFHLVWTGVPPRDPNIAGILSNDLVNWYDVAPISPPFSLNLTARTGHQEATMVNITVTAHACCICVPGGSPETTTLLGPPCSSTPPRFMVTEAYFSTFKEPEDILPTTSVVVGQTNPLMSTGALENLAGKLGNVSTPDFTSAFQNLCQAIYHLVRLDLGVIVDNQIYNSPHMFSLSIMPVKLPASLNFPSFGNDSLVAISNFTLMTQWRQRVEFYQTSDRVPVMDYLRPVPRLKPLGSAITSVFVSTFAMLSVLWTIFSLGAGALARRTAPARQRLSARTDLEEKISGESDSGWNMGTSTSFAFHKEPAPAHNVEDDMGRMKHDMGGMKHDMREMKRIMRLLLEKQGLTDDRLDHDLKANPNVKDGILSPLVHRRSSSSDRA